MPTFRYANPPVIHWGPGCVAAGLPGELGRLGAGRVLLVTTRSAVADPALAPAVEAILGERLAGRAVVGQHAPVGEVMAAAEAARDLRADALVSLGGGSPVDAAKAVAFSLATGLDLRAPDAPARAREATVGPVLPHLALPTTLSVAELSSSAGFSAEGTREKVGVSAPALCPAAVLYDARLAVRTPVPLWLSTGVRAVDHAAETLLAEGEHPLPDAAALDGLRRLAAALPAVRARPGDEAARTECQLGAWLTYLLPGPAARGLSHTLGKRLGSRHGIPHGVTSCLLLPHVLRYLAPRAPGPLARIAAALGAPDAAGGVAALLDRLGVPRRLSEFGLSDADLVEAARPLATAALPLEDLVGILRAAS
ncbi:iron-containing alcohol dehydrogenase [Anaeromyxobacter paludicola]|uniref:Maleylacetate reductase n=1 Tax=Anaeromyxobacter paludicola TaxID=2918171 RepID=A0ABM7XFQ3_9BACT|nr:iron-containing alcohol dehydrogenase [Anaeromyxobacter paludicola]BDG10730.1 maleylacetate reductase [Anaeromyxobacter paludicola]